MSEPGGSSAAEPVAGVPQRGRGAVAASILGAFLIAAYFAASPGGVPTPWAEYLLHAAILAVAFWFPALRVGSVRDVQRQWKGFLAWILAWTAVWDFASSGILLWRAWFQEWWIVYPAGLVTLAGLILAHGAIMDRVGRRSVRAGGRR